MLLYPLKAKPDFAIKTNYHSRIPKHIIDHWWLVLLIHDFMKSICFLKTNKQPFIVCLNCNTTTERGSDYDDNDIKLSLLIYQLKTILIEEVVVHADISTESFTSISCHPKQTPLGLCKITLRGSIYTFIHIIMLFRSDLTCHSIVATVKATVSSFHRRDIPSDVDGDERPFQSIHQTIAIIPRGA